MSPCFSAIKVRPLRTSEVRTSGSGRRRRGLVPHDHRSPGGEGSTVLLFDPPECDKRRRIRAWATTQNYGGAGKFAFFGETTWALHLRTSGFDVTLSRAVQYSPVCMSIEINWRKSMSISNFAVALALSAISASAFAKDHRSTQGAIHAAPAQSAATIVDGCVLPPVKQASSAVRTSSRREMRDPPELRRNR